MKLSNTTYRKFEESYNVNNRQVLTPTGYKDILRIHKTIPYNKFRIKTENGFILECADNHIVITSDGGEVFAKNAYNLILETINGPSLCIEVLDCQCEESMYDIEIDGDEHLYFSNGILSHNTVTTSTYLLWRALFGGGDLNIGIAAQKWSMAIEVLDKIKETYLTLPIWMQQGITLWNRTSIKLENGTVLITSTANGDAFRGFSIRLLFCDEIGFVKPTKWKDFEDSVFPSTSSFDDAQIIMCSTPNGMNHFYDFVEGAKNDTNGYKLTRADWWEHPDRTQEWADRVISENGIIFFNQNYGLDFIGSSYTLVNGFVLSNIKPIEPELVNKFVDGFKIFNRVENEHKYILSVDSAKDGSDEFSMHVIDITSMPFKQVACSNLQINYLEMPPVIKDIAEYYNNAHVIIENVEGSGQSCVDQLYIIYEYNNIYKDKGKKYYGFRTTKSSRRNILNMMRFFIEEKKLIINDVNTKTQLLNFIKINNKYQADDGCKDDLVMALAIAFVPFQNIRNFEDLPKFLEMIKEEISDDSESKKIEDFISFGYFDDSTEVDTVSNEQVYISGFL